MFIDRVKIFVASGAGGRGCVSFRREKFVPQGGPDGGDGGRGGSVILRADASKHTLLDVKYRPHLRAQRGSHGEGKNRHGKDAPNLVVRVPLGTVVRDEEMRIIADLVEDGQEVVVARGGRGGRGNAHFKSPTNQAPRFAEEGAPGEEKTLILELKLIADVGIVGMPNAGKSTLLARISNAHPKIADYPFTTLEPNLGVVQFDTGDSFVVADIPGLIEGAHEGRGLGDEFLRHVERTKLLIHLVDISSDDPVKNFSTINGELEKYSPLLASKPQMVALNKIDLWDGIPLARENYERFTRRFSDLDVYPISAATGSGVRELIEAIRRKLPMIPPPPTEEIQKPDAEVGEEPPFTLRRDEDGAFVIEGGRVERLVRMTNLDSEDALKRMYSTMERMGVEEALRRAGIKDGDPVRVGDIEFEYWSNPYLRDLESEGEP
ncbi:MAG: GTPase ObgE [bacterium]